MAEADAKRDGTLATAQLRRRRGILGLDERGEASARAPATGARVPRVALEAYHPHFRNIHLEHEDAFAEVARRFVAENRARLERLAAEDRARQKRSQPEEWPHTDVMLGTADLLGKPWKRGHA